MLLPNVPGFRILRTESIFYLLKVSVDYLQKYREEYILAIHRDKFCLFFPNDFPRFSSTTLLRNIQGNTSKGKHRLL